MNDFLDNKVSRSTFRAEERLPRLVVFSGAGISAESGIATFRDSDGLWHGHDPRDVANYDTWRANHTLVHEFYNHRRVELGRASPNLAHAAVATWQRAYPGRVINITQNIDDLFERAGVVDTVHLHGFLRNLRNIRTEELRDIGYSGFDATTDPDRIIKPDVVFFGEMAPLYRVLSDIANTLDASDTVISIGSSGAVVNIDPIVEMTGALGILNVLDNVVGAIDEHVWDKRFYEPATLAVPAIDAIVRERMGLAASSEV
ncbi:SIR2 family NAD-dependent protein deacylase [Pseudochelatococcus contaminans]|uniref:protein acetyllysine N-acetyltransferase n=1 Tax=Pseudochelatococcus contaminans TaxID=1538103 RepID=A0A7W5Z2J5_9HYPH|nr:Sir2 family NAD-dependent protein deacetylase [Pseudochelatococcus contaminans]MBB3808665.1 NAD-dependent deacetylase [Pseudochelatococcus contaminans]